MRLRREAAIIRRMQNRNTSFQNSSCTLCVPMFKVVVVVFFFLRLLVCLFYVDVILESALTP